MSDPLEKLGDTCEIVGDKCKELVKARKEKQIGDLKFVNQYFALVEEMPKGEKRNKVVKELENYLKKENKLGDTSFLK